jgi:hypothetical protein
MLHMVKMQALKPLTDTVYGTVQPGEMFEVDNRRAEKLESRGLACRYRPPRRTVAPPPPAEKMTGPAENKMLGRFANK